MNNEVLLRRKNCNPILIAVFSGLVSPLSSLIWAIRLRKPLLAILPISTVVAAIIYMTLFPKVNDLYVLTCFNIIAALSVYKIAKADKDELINFSNDN